MTKKYPNGILNSRLKKRSLGSIASPMISFHSTTSIFTSKGLCIGNLSRALTPQPLKILYQMERKPSNSNPKPFLKPSINKS